MQSVLPSSVIKIDNLTRKFKDVTAVDNLSLVINKGEVFGILGPDGAGKTTLLRMLAGLLKPSSGSILILNSKDRNKLKNKIGYLSQRFTIYEDLTVLENLNFYADLYSVSASGKKERIERLLEITRLSEFMHRRTGHLSGGMKQKLALCSILIYEPEILLLDEPTTGIDILARKELWKILRDLNSQGKTIVVTVSYLEEAKNTGRLAFLQDGKLYAQGRLDELTKGKTQSLEEYFISLISPKDEVDSGLSP